jgi:UDP-glucuronate 4-epimerase
MESDKKVLVTGSAGFIGMHLTKSLLEDGYKVFGIDNMNDYYDPNLKEERNALLARYEEFTFSKIDISDLNALSQVFSEFKPNKVVNLAAQAGVRYSLENPHVYIDSNVTGFMNILECSRHHNVKGLIYASSSSVYGGNLKTPFSVEDPVDKPISIYAATKKANELMACTYSHLFNLHTTGLRFFTVYGPWGRPDMAMYIFSKNIINNKKIQVFNHGNMQRDFTYIDDIISGIRLSIDNNYKCEVFNLGNNSCEKLMYVISLLEESLGEKAKIEFKGMQKGDVKKTFADINYSKKKLGYNPSTKISQGIPRFIDWFNNYHKR